MFGLFKWVEELVGNVIQQVMQQINVVQEAVTAPLRGLVNQVVGGVWKGDGASKFTQEMTSEVIPMLANIMNVQTNFANAIKKAQDSMNQAMQQATSQAQGLFDVFNGIF
jgi:predicted histidine transporter YuiF (NhaC family)